MNKDLYSVKERLSFYLLQLLLKLYKKLSKKGCSKICEKCLRDLLSRPIDIENISQVEKISFLKKILQRYLLPESIFRNF